MIDEHDLRAELNHGIVQARADYYRQGFDGDRFDGLYNFDMAQGAEKALRTIARRFDIPVVDEEKTRISAAITIEYEAEQDGEKLDEDFLEYLEAARVGEEGLIC